MKFKTYAAATFISLGTLIPCAANAMGLQDALTASYAAESKKDLPGALKPIAAMERREGSNYIVQLRLGWLYYQSAQNSESVEHYKKACQLAPKAVEPLLAMANV